MISKASIQRGLCSRGWSGSGGSSGVAVAAVCVERGQDGAGDDPRLIGDDDGFRGDAFDRFLSKDWSAEVSEEGLGSAVVGGGIKAGSEGTGGRGGFSSSSGGGGGGGASDGGGGGGRFSAGSGSGSGGAAGILSSSAEGLSSGLAVFCSLSERGGGGGFPVSVASVATFFTSPPSSPDLSHDIEPGLELNLALFLTSSFFPSVERASRGGDRPRHLSLSSAEFDLCLLNLPRDKGGE